MMILTMLMKIFCPGMSGVATIIMTDGSHKKNGNSKNEL